MERFSSLQALGHNLYAEGSPVILAAGSLLKDNEKGGVLAQLKFRNISPKELKALTVKVNAFDVSGKPLQGVEGFQYLDLTAARDAEFGAKTPVLLPDNTTREIRAECVNAVFSDGGVWTADGAPWEPLPEQKTVESRFSDEEMQKQYKLRFGNAEKLYSEEKDLWFCACGAVNRQGEDSCHACRRMQKDICTLDEAKLAAEKDARLAEEKAAAEKAAAEREASARKTKKTLRIVLPIIAVCIIAAVFAAKVFIPNSRYNAAVKLCEKGRYEESMAAFEALGDYKDSAGQIEIVKLEQEYALAESFYNSGDFEQAIAEFNSISSYKDSEGRIREIKEEIYSSAISLYNNGNYEEAIEKFNRIIDFKDSKEQIAVCEAAAKDEAYDAALALFESGEYEKAQAAFKALGNHRDSKEQIKLCKEAIPERDYQAALALYNAGEYSKAVSAFEALGNFKDSEETILEIKHLPEYYAQCAIGNTLYFGAYEQDNNTSNGKEDVEWIVLAKKDNKLLLISKYGLDHQPYNKNGGKTTWEECSLRSWLNRDFLNKAFTAEEQALIQMTYVFSDDSYDNNRGNPTQDKVFLLSGYEVGKYMGKQRMCVPTEFALAQGVTVFESHKVDGKATGAWPLRSLGKYSYLAKYVANDGSVQSFGNDVKFSTGAVRPAFWLTLES